MTINDKIAALRSAMTAHQLDAYILPSGDPHQGEYVADHWKARQWISGFSGSAGIAVITQDHAGLWTDSRYFLQAEEELKGSGMALQKQGVAHAPEHISWLRENLPAGSKVGIDGKLFSVGQVRRLAKAFYEKNIELETGVDLVAELWKDRPPLPQNAVFEHEVSYAGLSRAQKLEAVRGKMGQADYYLISTLDDIAWLFNLRGSDVECNPVFYSYAVIGRAEAYLFIEESKLPEDLKTTLLPDGIFAKPYHQLESFLKELPANKSIFIDLVSTSNQVYSAIRKEQIIEGRNIVLQMKAIKNPVEIEHIKDAMLKDGVALTRLFRWLEDSLKNRAVPETEVAEKLAEFRRAQGDYHGESFDAIVGYNSNGAIVHYHAMQESCAHIQDKGILLLDSGGQYIDGTTDITRTIALGEPTEEQKRHFTLVLKGHIALATIKFPEGTSGAQLDTLARMFLWRDNLNYGHGTGHGVGFFLNVHEPPQGFAASSSTSRGTTAIEPGMFTSNEPGFYKTGEYGIRIENLVLCVEDAENDFGKFLKFETLTLFPIDLKLIDKSLVSEGEKSWLNAYHAEVFEKIAPLLDGEEVGWLKEKCKAL